MYMIFTILMVLVEYFYFDRTQLNFKMIKTLNPTSYIRAKVFVKLLTEPLIRGIQETIRQRLPAAFFSKQAICCLLSGFLLPGALKMDHLPLPLSNYFTFLGREQSELILLTPHRRGSSLNFFNDLQNCSVSGAFKMRHL